ncbi:MAG: hypothetical protein J0L92_25410, partial [Deltaproteobacteria bacterium]|nr:hypothetical protein [Deltaproteobacteria bacterium]
MRVSARALGAALTLVAVAFGVAACAQDTLLQTGVEVHVTYDDPAPDQLEISGALTGPDGVPREVLAPTRRPETPRPLTAEGESLVLFFDATDGGSTFVARVDGLVSGARVSSGAASIRLVADEVTVVEVHLGAPVVCGDGRVAMLVEACDDGNLDPGDGCDARCTVEPGWSCANDAASASRCQDHCGSGPACGEGQRCVDEACVCDAVSCASGCCDGDTCRAGMEPSACGAAGLACTRCPAGESCEGGHCSGCDAESCPEGCCSGSTCLPRSVMACGTEGATCSPCSEPSSDGCGDDGACACGTGPACSVGQRCVGGLCICDETSCPAGCCDGASCRLRSRATCGAAGASCVACDPTLAETCTADGACACGSGPSCRPGQRCASGRCVCDPRSCPEGCCAGDLCEPIAATSCGRGGGSCTSCDPTVADGCSGGRCSCGGGAACAAGQRCEWGSCVCDAAACAGCCQG